MQKGFDKCAKTKIKYYDGKCRMERKRMILFMFKSKFNIRMFRVPKQFPWAIEKVCTVYEHKIFNFKSFTPTV